MTAIPYIDQRGKRRDKHTEIYILQQSINRWIGARRPNLRSIIGRNDD